MTQSILVQEQGLEVLQARNARGQDLDQVVAQDESLQLVQGSHRLRHLADEVAAQGQDMQAARIQVKSVKNFLKQKRERDMSLN